MQKYQDSVIDQEGNAIEGASVSVALESGAAATIYSDDGSTLITSITTDENGYFFFYASNNRYQITITGSSLETRTIRDIVLYDDVDDTFGSATQTELLDMTSTVNTTSKFTGRYVWDSTNSLPLYAAGSAVDDVWKKFSDDTTAHSPS